MIENEIGITAREGGRALTLESTRTGTTDVPVPFHRVGTPPLFAGFRLGWVDGDDPATGATFNMSAGAGTGSRYLTIQVELPDGRVVHEVVDMVEVFEKRVTAILGEMSAGQE